jgi:hypothetical protein
MAMEKYGDSTQVVATLIKMKLCESEDEAMEKVASGEAPSMIKDFKMKLFNDMTKLYDENLEEVSPELADEFKKIKKELEEE